MATSPPDWRAKPKIWLRPRPVPLPTGLVVKKGSNTRSRCSGAMPLPVSRDADPDIVAGRQIGDLGLGQA